MDYNNMKNLYINELKYLISIKLLILVQKLSLERFRKEEGAEIRYFWENLDFC